MPDTYEVEWPPPVYEMPTYVPYDAADLEPVTDILKGTMKSTTNTGMSIMGALVSVSLVFSIVGGFLRHKFAVSDGVRRNELRREIGNLDMKRNSEDIAINREMNMHMNFLAKQRYHRNHHDDEVAEGIYQRELSHEIDQKIREKHPEWAVERRINSAETERLFREQTRQQRLEDFIRRTEERDEFEAALRQQHRDRAAQRIVQNRLDGLEANEILRSEHGEKLVHDAVQRSWVNDEAQAAYRGQNPAGAIRRSVQNRLDSMEADKVLRSEYREELVNNRAEGIIISREAKERARAIVIKKSPEPEINPETGEISEAAREAEAVDAFVENFRRNRRRRKR